MEPQPLSNTAKGGKIIDKITRQILIISILYKTGNKDKISNLYSQLILSITLVGTLIVIIFAAAILKQEATKF